LLKRCTGRIFAVVGIVVIVAAAGTLTAAIAIGGNIYLSVLGLLLAATSMELLRLAYGDTK